LSKTFLVIEYTRVEKSGIKDFFSFQDGRVVGALAKNANWVAEWRRVVDRPIWQYDELKEAGGADYLEFSSIFSQVISDPRVTYLLERRFKEDVLASVFNSVVVVEQICFGAFSVLKKVGAERVIFHTPPHHLHDYLFSKIAEYLGLDVFVVKLSPLPWRAWLCSGIDEQRVVSRAVHLKNDLTETTKLYIESLSGPYDQAMPEYERRLASQAKGRMLSINADLKGAFTLILSRHPLRSIFRLLAICRKIKLYKRYVNISRDFKLPQEFLVFFLHFQPERTSVPEGLSYSAQWLAIKEISEALPAGVKLVVKEHQAMFRRQLDPRTRDVEFYDAVAGLHNVVVAPLDFDTFTLLDLSKAIVTLTGTVGFEALVRKKKVIALGVAPYKDCDNVFSPRCYEDLVRALSQIDLSPSGDFLTEYLLWVEANSSCAATLPDGKGIAYFNVESERQCINQEFRSAFLLV